MLMSQLQITLVIFDSSYQVLPPFPYSNITLNSLDPVFL